MAKHEVSRSVTRDFLLHAIAVPKQITTKIKNRDCNRVYRVTPRDTTHVVNGKPHGK